MYIEMVIYGRGGQGGVTAGNILVLASMYEGLYAQSFPFFGAERRGAPVMSFVRLSDKPILRHGMFSTADVLILLDKRLIDIGVSKNVKVRNGGVVIINSPIDYKVNPNSFDLQGRASFYAVDATRIALENKLIVAGWPLVNTSILGSFSKATGIVKIENITKAIKEYFGAKAGEMNARAAQQAYEETTLIEKVD